MVPWVQSHKVISIHTVIKPLYNKAIQTWHVRFQEEPAHENHVEVYLNSNRKQVDKYMLFFLVESSEITNLWCELYTFTDAKLTNSITLISFKKLGFSLSTIRFWVLIIVHYNKFLTALAWILSIFNQPN
jgi:hypothetical protein